MIKYLLIALFWSVHAVSAKDYWATYKTAYTHCYYKISYTTRSAGQSSIVAAICADTYMKYNFRSAKGRNESSH